MNTYHQEMINGFLSARGIDDRGCAYIILEALKRAKAVDLEAEMREEPITGAPLSLRTPEGWHFFGQGYQLD